MFKLFRTKKLSETEILATYRQSGNTELLGELFDQYSHLVFGVCMKYLKNTEDSQDAVMQIFEKLISDLRKHEVLNFKSWVCSVARNHCLMQLRGKKIMLSDAENLSESMEFSYELHLDTNKEDELKKLSQALSQLPDHQRQCIELFYLEQKCYKDIADQTGYDIKAVKSHIQNGKRNLKIYLENKL